MSPLGRLGTPSMPGWEAALNVESTMRTGYEHGFRVITLTDCVAAAS
ncbi:hypothetical protein [Streptomyces sp. NPDC005141]